MIPSINFVAKAAETIHASVASLQFLNLVHCSALAEDVLGVLAIISLCHVLLEGWKWGARRISTDPSKAKN